MARSDIRMVGISDCLLRLLSKCPWQSAALTENLNVLSVQDLSLAYPHYAFAQRERAKWASGKRPVTS